METPVTMSGMGYSARERKQVNGGTIAIGPHKIRHSDHKCDVCGCSAAQLARGEALECKPPKPDYLKITREMANR